ncbi:MAG: glycoside hydrolase family 20 zincin-like fold domain-containing protein, partial [Phycisphaerae bacterium]
MEAYASCAILALVSAMSLIPAAASVTELRARGYSLIPTPQRLELQETDLTVEPTWGLTLQNVDRDDIAVQTLLAGLRDHGLELQGTADAASQFRLAIRQDAVTTNTDPERQAQAYLLQMRPTAVEIVGNTAQGLFYGVQTVLQLLRPIGPARLALPAGTIGDWPAYQLRILHWDTKHHQDRIETLKRYLDWSARFKINAIAWELEDKFEYPSHPVIGAPGAFTTAQIQELVRYGLQRYIQIIPDIQAPAHMAYVLKHPEFAHLRSDGSNYQICMCCDEAIRLIFDMYQDVLEATEGVDYFFVSTDEVYYAGIDPRCQRPYNPLNRSLTWVEFVNRAHRFLSERGRRVLIWAEYPLLTEHVHLLPPDIIDGIIGGNEEFIRAENQRGIRQLAYVPIQGSEKPFPNYFTYQRHGQHTPGRLAAVYEGTLRGKASRGNP